MTLLTPDAKGVFIIAVTPFTENGAVDYDGLERLTDFYLSKGVSGITILGMMGEAGKLSAEEAREVARRVIARAGNTPVVAGVSAPGLAAMKALSDSVMDMGAAGVMVAPPMILRSDIQTLTYYQNVAATLGDATPIVLQDFPLATTVQISVELLSRIIDAVPNVVMLKHEDWPGLAKISALRAAEQAGQCRISVLCGNGGVFLPEEMGRGADGAMTGFGFPEMLVSVIDLVNHGHMDQAQDLFDAYLPLVRYEQQPGLGLAVRKYVLQKRGAIASDFVRQPGARLPAPAIVDVERLLLRQARRLAELG